MFPSTHLSSSSPPAMSASLLRLPTCQPDRYLLLAVRPSHLSHRSLFQRMIKAPPFVDIHVPFPGDGESAPPTPPGALPCLAVRKQNHQSAHSASCCSQEPNRADIFPASSDLVSEQQRQYRPTSVSCAKTFMNIHQCPPAHTEVSAPGNRLSGAISPENHTVSGLRAEATPEKAHFPDSPPLSPASSTSQRGLKLLESIPEISDSSTPACGELSTLVKTGGGRFSGPHLEVPHNDNGVSSSSSSSSAATTPSPGRQTLAERIKKFKLPGSEKSSPNGQSEKQRYNSQPEYGSWITVIQDGTHEKTQSRFPTQ